MRKASNVGIENPGVITAFPAAGCPRSSISFPNQRVRVCGQSFRISSWFRITVKASGRAAGV
jgi:hypothetical protein